MNTNDDAMTRMLELVQRWQQAADQRFIFLDCYALMTRNMLAALAGTEFMDPRWVDRLLHRFAEYYFTALDAYEQDPDSTPRVWKIAHNSARAPHTMALQKLLLGVNAHINYDLVLALVDVLEVEWPKLTELQRSGRYTDHCRVNEVIGRTIDAVQDQVLDPVMPAMDIIDRIMGSLDERMISGLISNWRESVWQHATLLLESQDAGERTKYLKQVEEHALRLAEMIE